MAAKETAKLMAWGLGPDWQAANASAPITNVVNGIRRGMFIAANPANQGKVELPSGLVQHTHKAIPDLLKTQPVMLCVGSAALQGCVCMPCMFTCFGNANPVAVNVFLLFIGTSTRIPNLQGDVI